MNKKAIRFLFLVTAFIFGSQYLFSQHRRISRPVTRAVVRPLYDPALNQLLFPGNSAASWNTLFRSFDSLVCKGDRTIHFLHIGDSHIQAGFLQEQLNRELSDLLAPGCGGRGFIFPYRMAKSNNPTNYSIKFSGNWNHCRNVETSRDCDLGLAGMMVSTYDTLSDLHLLLKPSPVAYDFNDLKIFHDSSANHFTIDFPAWQGHFVTLQPEAGVTEFKFDTYLDSLWIRICRTDTVSRNLVLYGMEVKNGDPGIVYSSVGVNGAEFTSFLRCNRLESQLREVNPQCLIVSLGTNDGFVARFDPDSFLLNARQVIRNLRRAMPGIPILLTTPGDSYRKRRYDNKNLVLVREILIKIAAEEDCAVWDFYSVMGGPASMMTWYKAGLTAKDKVHFSKAGYYIQGDLLYQAIRDAWFIHLDKRKN